ncbi:MAG: prepilin-type N-terminal cleavage/methylation domain-containing protein [Planctomycetota bacterium]
MRTPRHVIRGFTLLELMIAMTLMMIIMLMLNSMFTNAQTLYTTAAKRATIYQQARVAMDFMEKDLLLLHANKETAIAMRSLEPNDWNNVDTCRNGQQNSVLNDWITPDPNQTTKIREFLSFPATKSVWIDDMYGKDQGGYRNGLWLVVYYLRKRMDPVDDLQYEGAYLVRRMIPIRSQAQLVAIGQGKSDPKDDLGFVVVEDEICSFVSSVRIFVDDQGAVMYNRKNNNVRRFEIMPEVHENMKNKWMWVAEDINASNPQPSSGSMILPIPAKEYRAEFGGIWQTFSGNDRQFASSRWNYPSVVMIELTINNKAMERLDDEKFKGRGTYRTFSRAVQIPLAGPMNNLDTIDAKFVK